MKLYYLKGACSLVPHIALEIIGAGYEAEEATRELIKSPEYLKLNPQGQVPLLIDGDLVLPQNIAILTYLDNIHPEAKLMGAETIAGKARTMRWLAFINADLHKAFSFLFHAPKDLDENAQKILKDGAQSRILTMLGECNAQLEKQKWLGDDFSVADIYLYVILRWCNSLKLDYSQHTKLADFFQRVEAKPQVQTVLGVQGLK